MTQTRECRETGNDGGGKKQGSSKSHAYPAQG